MAKSFRQLAEERRKKPVEIEDSQTAIEQVTGAVSTTRFEEAERRLREYPALLQERDELAELLRIAWTAREKGRTLTDEMRERIEAAVVRCNNGYLSNADPGDEINQ
jgi:hypothetical protein